MNTPVTERIPSRAAQALGVCCAALLCLAAPASAAFVTFESGQVRPLALAGSKLYAVNTPDNRLEIFDVSAGGLTHTGAVPVGMEPVAVAVRPDGNQVWVVNHLSDSVSIIDLTATPPRVVRTLLVGDEPRDIVFAAGRAFITTAHRGQNTSLQATIDTVLRSEGIERADVWVFDAADQGTSLGGTPVAGTPVTLFGDTPRALAVSADGNTVYAAVFHSGDQTTTVSEPAVCNGGSARPPCALDGTTMPNGLAGGLVPGGLPAPNQNLAGDPGPEVGLIVKFDEGDGQWKDRGGRNWTNAVRFSLPDLDVFAINATASPPVETASFAHVGTVLFNMVVNPSSGRVYVSNTDARNEVRFEGPGGGGSTVRGHLHEARITVLDGGTVPPHHLNKHIDALPLGYRTVPMTAGIKDDSLATPLGMAVSSDGSTLYLAAFGSSKVGIFDTAELEADTFTPSSSNHIAVTGGGPSGLVLDEPNERLYVFTRFDNSISVINTTTRAEIDHLPVFNPEPASVVNGRPFLYDATFTSSNGEASCSSCHVFADFDSLAWDLGNPDDIVRPNPNAGGPIFSDQDFHPMKGPMTTQTLRGMAHDGPMHWRGDRTGGYAAPNIPPDSGSFDEQAAFTAFQVAFDGLLGRDEGPLPAADMQAFTNFILQVTLPPNPIRNLNNDLSPEASLGQGVFIGPISDTVTTCDGCHTVDPSQGFFGTGALSTFESETQEFKVAHLRNLYQKIGMFGLPNVGPILPGDNGDKGPQVRGFGFLHDGSVDTIFRFHRGAVFLALTDMQRLQLEAFMFEFDSTLAPIVGQQTTLTNTNGAVVGGRIDLLIESAEDPFTVFGVPAAHECDLIAKGVVNGEERGYVYNPSTHRFRSDRAGDMPLTDAALRTAIDTVDESLTYTCAPPGSGTRMGVDRDEDGFFDSDELDAGSDPADPNSIPGGGPTPTNTASPTPTPTPVLCDPVPRSGCRVAGKSSLLVRENTSDPAKRKLVWKWRQGIDPLDPSALGDPTTSTSYALCLYAFPVAQILAPPSATKWTAEGAGFNYLNTALPLAGMQKMRLRAGAAGKPKVLVKATGPGLPQQLHPFAVPVTIQLINGAGECWESVFSNVLRNDSHRFRSKF